MAKASSNSLSTHQRAMLDVFHENGELPKRITRAWLSKLSDKDLAAIQEIMDHKRKDATLTYSERKSALATYSFILKLRDGGKKSKGNSKGS